ncbi:MFS transporter [Nonomuraea sp. NPDC055795]
MRPAAAVSAVFFTHALLVAACVSRISSLKHGLGLSDAQLGLALLAGPLCSVAAMFAAGQLVKRIGGGRALRRTVPLMCAAAPLPGLADSLWSLALFLGIWGGVEGIVGVAMNAHAVDVESATAKPIMSRLHGFWSLGALAGGVAGTVAGYAGQPVALQGAELGLAAFAAFVVLAPRPVTTKARPVGSGGRPAGMVLVLLGVVAFSSNLAEGSAQTWSSVFFTDTAGAPRELAGLGLAVYAVSMFTSRLFIDRVLGRFGTVRTVRALMVLAGLGFLPALLVPHPVTAIAGLMAVGLGFSPVIPAALRASSKIPGIAPGPALATVSGLTWGAMMCGPPLVGGLAAVSGVGVALGLVLAFAIVVIGCFAYALRLGAVEALDGPQGG